MTSIRRLVIAALSGLTLISTSAAYAEEPPAPTPFTFERDGVVIAGEVHAMPGANTAVIIVGGSAYRTRADAAFIVPVFVDARTAVVLYDRRGNGQSTGAFETPTTANTAWQIPIFAEDVAAIAAHLKQDLGFRRVGLLGSSMGGWVNVAAAARSSDIDFVANLNGGASTVGVSDEFSRWIEEEGHAIEAATEATRAYAGIPGYDPNPDIELMNQPAFWVYSGRDASNPSTLDIETLERYRATGKRFSYIVVARADHDMRNVDTGEPALEWVEPMRAFIHGD